MSIIKGSMEVHEVTRIEVSEIKSYRGEDNKPFYALHIKVFNKDYDEVEYAVDCVLFSHNIECLNMVVETEE